MATLIFLCSATPPCCRTWNCSFAQKAFWEELHCISHSFLVVPCNRGRAIRPPSVPSTCARQRHHHFNACLSVVLLSTYEPPAQGTSCSLCMVRQAMSQAGLQQKDALLALNAGSWAQVSQCLTRIFCAFAAQRYSQTKGKPLQDEILINTTERWERIHCIHCHCTLHKIIIC